MEFITKNYIKLKKRKPTSHKGENGKILVIAGSEDYPGAAVLTTRAALSTLISGADLVTIAAPSKVSWVINTYSPEIITKKLEGKFLTLKHFKVIKELAVKNDVILIGPGLGRIKQTLALIKKILQINKQKVIDADAIYAVNLNSLKNSIITPHKKEFEILLKNNKLNENNFREYLNNNVTLFKGKIDKIISKDHIIYNKTGNVGMTKGGTGDILAGLCAGFLAQKNSLFMSACAAAYINGKIADKLKEKLGYTYLTSQILENIQKEVKPFLK